MAGRRNHRGWIVLDSVASADGMFCVDLFHDPGNGFGFEHFRSDPEDMGAWQLVGGFGGQRFDSREAAVEGAFDQVPWLGVESPAAFKGGA